MTTHTTTETRSTSTRAAHSHRIRVTALTVVAAAALLPMTSAAAGPPPLPPDTHCPAAQTLTAVTAFAGTIYETFVAASDLNGNGYVCVRPFTDAAATALDPRFNLPPGSPIYHVGDDSLP